MPRTARQIRDELAAIEAEFTPAVIPAGTPDRRRLQREAREDAFRRACLPENVARRLALQDELHRLERSEKAKAAAAARKADPQEQLRQYVFRKLRGMGFWREAKTESGSAYYAHSDGMRVRISDHEVPLTNERFEASMNGGFTWALGWSLTIDGDTTWIDAARWLVSVRQRVRRTSERLGAKPHA